MSSRTEQVGSSPPDRDRAARVPVEFVDRIDPELAVIASAMPDRDLDDIPGQRVRTMQMITAMRADLKPSTTVAHEDHVVPGRAGDPDVRVRVYRPREAAGILGALYWIHGGGYMAGSIEQDDPICEGIAEAVGCTVASVEWRLAPENPYPAAVDDASAGLRWLFAHAKELQIDATRIGVGGASSGAGAAAGLSLRVRDREDFSPCLQLLLYPMLDDRPSRSRTITYSKVWNSAANELGWRSYLGAAYGHDGVSPYAAPARARDLTGLPPTFIGVGELDLFVDEDITYAQRLIDAGVPTELHVYAGAIHGFDILAPDAHVSRRLIDERNQFLRRSLAAANATGEVRPAQV